MSRHTYDRHLLGLEFAQYVELRKPNQTSFLHRVTPFLKQRVQPGAEVPLKGMLTRLHERAVALRAEQVNHQAIARSDLSTRERGRAVKAATKEICDIGDEIAAIYLKPSGGPLNRSAATGKDVIEALNKVLIF